MRIISCLAVFLVLLSGLAHAGGGDVVSSDNVKARLVGEASSIAPGQTIWTALELTIRDGWHTYWRNPGDSGEATKLTWNLPPGFTAGEIVWTVPHRFEVTPLVNYGYAGHAMHMVQITAPKDMKPGLPVTLSAKATWLVCSDVCIPESADLSLKLPVSAANGAADSSVAGLFAAARAQLPSPQLAATHVDIKNGQLVLVLGKEWGDTLRQTTDLAFFPYAEGSIEYAAPQVFSRTPDTVELALKVGYQPPSAGKIGGVLIATEQNGKETLAVPMEISADYAGAGNAVLTPAPQFGAVGNSVPKGNEPAQPLLVLMLLAAAGGVILNLMPCVFPVLSIKALGLVEQARKQPSTVRLKGLAFAGGVIASMLALAAVLLALRAGGEQIGWGFQLQSPLFVAMMVYLLFAIGLNLSGVFEIGGGLSGVGDGLTQGDGYRASFFTGVLTTLVATPCTAPFMAAAVGEALTQPPIVALSIFTALGVGLALPFTLLSFVPSLRKALPKPGAWMDTLKQLFAFPIYASAAWLLWVLAQQTSSLGLGATLAGAILLALAAWSYQKSKLASSSGRLAALLTAAFALVLAIGLPIKFADVATAADVSSRNQGSDQWQPYDAQKLAQLNTDSKPVLVNFTASWCLTCLVNERNAFGDAAVQEIFRGKGVTLMKGDWTNRDPAITQALSSFGRAGVPLYVAYNAKPGNKEPVVLPQLLSASIVHDTFASLPNRDLK